ncbi:MAG: N-acetylneuraminate lyase [Christensenellales bacterium]|jgi:N-acetylneuraminate lyase
MNGIFSALMGAFRADGALSEAGMRALVRHNIDVCGVDGLYVNGSTGEIFLMTQKMRQSALRIAASEAQGKVKLIAHVGVLCMEEIHAMTALAADLGYDAVSAVTPFYYKYTVDEIIRYYEMIARRSPLPVVAYYIPHLSGVSMSADALCRILDVPGVAGIKFTSNDLFALERLRALRPDKTIYAGFDEMLLPALALGADGAIGSTYNVIGHWAKQLAARMAAGDLAGARTVQQKMNAVITALIESGLFGTLKALCRQYDLPVGDCLPPMSPTTDAQNQAATRIKDMIARGI